jgi:copper oxidase (laccase) domain-containing protein
MRKHTSDGLVFYSFEILKGHPEMAHGVFTRRGPSGGDFNLSYEHGDEGEVNRNILLARNALGLEKGPLAFVNQAHGSLILEPEISYSPCSSKDLIGGFDALIGRPGANLMIKLADCQGILLYSPPSKIFALVHSGWRGSVLNILGKTVARLRDSYGVRPQSLLAGVSPSIGPCHMEFKSYREDLPRELWGYKAGRKDKAGDKAGDGIKDGTKDENGSGDYFDFPRLTLDQLTDSGVLKENVEFSGFCSYCEEDLFYSHRRGDRGRFAVMAGLTQNLTPRGSQGSSQGGSL